MARPVVLRPDIQVFAEISAVDQLVTRALDRALPAGLGRAQFNLLNHLAHSEDQSPGDLARRFALTKGAITHLIIRLEQQRLIVLATVPTDQRRKRVQLTEAGARMLAEAQGALREVARDLRQALTPEGFSETLPLLTALRQHLTQAI